jgi:hypothetical protein
MADSVTCGNGCCIWRSGLWFHVISIKKPTPGTIAIAWHADFRAPGADTRIELCPRFCPHTGERLTVVDGQPVVEPRPSPALMDLLWEAASIVDEAWVADMLAQECGAGTCDHTNRPLDCIREEAEYREADGLPVGWRSTRAAANAEAQGGGAVSDRATP